MDRNFMGTKGSDSGWRKDLVEEVGTLLTGELVGELVGDGLDWKKTSLNELDCVVIPTERRMVPFAFGSW